MSIDCPLNPPYDCVVFDLDGTLLDTFDAMLGAINWALNKLGRPVMGPEVLLDAVHDGMTAMLDAALGEVGPAPDSALRSDACRLMFLAYRRRAAAGAAIYPGALELIRALKEAGVRLAVCTNQFEGNARLLLRATGLLGSFEHVLGRDSLPRFKPDPMPLVWIMTQTGVAPGRTLMVGDSVVDARCADAAGADAVLMGHGYGVHAAPETPRAPEFGMLLRWLV